MNDKAPFAARKGATAFLDQRETEEEEGGVAARRDLLDGADSRKKDSKRASPKPPSIEVSAELPFAARKRATASLNNEEPKEEEREVGAAASSNVLDETIYRVAVLEIYRHELGARITELVARDRQVDAALLRDYNETFCESDPIGLLKAGIQLSTTIAGPATNDQKTSATLGDLCQGGEEEALDADYEDLALERTDGGESSPRQDGVEVDRYLSRPGAYRMPVGREPHRASSGVSSDTASLAAAPRMAVATLPQRDAHAVGVAAADDDRALLVEANLVREEDVTGTLLVEAKPVRRKRQIAISVLVALAVTAIIVGLSVGLSANRLALPATPSPTPVPTSQLDQRFRLTLPPHTLESIRNMSSPQYYAYEWATEIDQVPWIEAPDDETLRLTRMKQRFALATLFYSAGGSAKWSNRSGWLNSTANECNWYGCCCGTNCPLNGNDDGGEDLAWLDLSRNRLGSSLPREIGLLTSLTHLDFSKNTLMGSVPSELGLLSALTSFNVYSNRLYSPIPAQLVFLTNMQLLDLSFNAFTGPIPTEMNQLRSLTVLDLNNNWLASTIPTELGLLTNLQILYLFQNLLTGPIPNHLSQLSKLTELLLSMNQLTSTIPTQLGLLTSLEALGAGRNVLTGPIPTELGALRGVTSLSLLTNRINSTIPTQLGRLTNMCCLGLNTNALTGTIPSELALMTSLAGVRLGENRLTGSVPAEICRLRQSSGLFGLLLDCGEVACDCNCTCSGKDGAFDDDYYYYGDDKGDQRQRR
jgi:hypothetical protein